MKAVIKNINGKIILTKKNNNMKNLILVFSLIATNAFCQNCPTDPCVDYTTTLNIENLPDCSTGTVKSVGDIDNNSDCNDINGGNCYKWIITKPASSIATGISVSVGQGNGCNGEVDNIYIENNSCADLGSSGSQNEFTANFNGSNSITI